LTDLMVSGKGMETMTEFIIHWSTLKVSSKHPKLGKIMEVEHVESKKRNWVVITGGLVLFLCLLMSGNAASVPLKNRTPILRSGDLFPFLSFPNLLNAEERRYLGVGGKAIFTLSDIQAEVLVIQFLNTNCVYCIKSVPAFNEIFQTIEQDQTLLKRIKILAISAGDTAMEVAAFKEQHAVPYPIIPDTEFKAHKAAHEPTVPFIVIARRDRREKWVVATVHVGLTFSAESFVGELRAILEIDPNTLKKD
jgi:peroxiredoxin